MTKDQPHQAERLVDVANTDLVLASEHHTAIDDHNEKCRPFSRFAACPQCCGQAESIRVCPVGNFKKIRYINIIFIVETLELLARRLIESASLEEVCTCGSHKSGMSTKVTGVWRVWR